MAQKVQVLLVDDFDGMAQKIQTLFIDDIDDIDGIGAGRTCGV
jgi:hypothetical protein